MGFVVIKLVSLALAVVMGLAIAYSIVRPYTIAVVDLLKAPWMITSIIDVYTGIFFFTCWVAHREKSLCITLLWVLIFVVLGNFGTALYVFLAAFRARDDAASFWNGNDVSDKWMHY